MGERRQVMTGELIREQANRVMQLEAALQKARPYVVQFAENCPPHDGGAEAVADLLAIDAALQLEASTLPTESMSMEEMKRLRDALDEKIAGF